MARVHPTTRPRRWRAKPTRARWWLGASRLRRWCWSRCRSARRDFLCRRSFHSPFPKSEPYRNEGRESKCLEASLVGSVLRKHHRAVRLVCQLPLGLRSFVGVLRSWTLASDLPGAVADCCQVSSANPGKSFEQIGGSELGGNFMVLHGRQLAAMRGCKGGRFAATRRYFVSLFVEPWRLPVTNG